MDPQRWARIESLYHAALEKDPGERSGYLAQECVGDPGLRREVETLLPYADADLRSPLPKTLPHRRRLLDSRSSASPWH